MKTTSIRNCQSCGVEFIPNDIAYYVPLDNNVVCFRCSLKHDKSDKRLVETENTCRGVSARHGILVDLLKDNDIYVSPTDTSFLRWIAEWGDDTADNLFCILNKCLGVGKGV